MPGTDNDLDLDQLRALARLLDEADLTEIEVEIGGSRIRLARQKTVAAALPAYAHPAGLAPASVAAGAPLGSPASEGAHPGAVTSPMVGTVYVAPEPGAAPFVQVGDMVEEGQTVLIVEAMKTMNPIPAPRGGRVSRILISDAQPVEFGEPLLIIE